MTPHGCEKNFEKKILNAAPEGILQKDPKRNSTPGRRGTFAEGNDAIGANPPEKKILDGWGGQNAQTPPKRSKKGLLSLSSSEKNSEAGSLSEDQRVFSDENSVPKAPPGGG